MKLLNFVILAIFIASCSQAPVQNPAPSPIPTLPSEPTPTEPVEPVPTQPDVVEIDSDNALKIAKQVDKYYGKNQLTKERKNNSFFYKSISQAVKESLVPRAIPLGSLHSTFGLATKNPVSLKEPLCKYDNTMAQRLIRTTISNASLSLINQFRDEVNSFTTDDQYHEAYSRLMMCLSYSESLGDPDTSRSYTIASREGVTKADGVKYYFDSLQTNPDSQINIGLFQFSPIASGNIFPCLSEFGAESRTRKGLVETLGKYDQLWNARCGVHKILTLFYVQKNTTHSSRKAGPNCSALHTFAGTGYNHFGPLQRQDGKIAGLNKLYNCYNGSKKL